MYLKVASLCTLVWVPGAFFGFYSTFLTIYMYFECYILSSSMGCKSRQPYLVGILFFPIKLSQDLAHLKNNTCSIHWKPVSWHCSLSLFLSRCLYLCLSVCLSLSLCLSLSVSLSLSLSPPPSLCLFHSLFLSDSCSHFSLLKVMMASMQIM